VQQESDMKRAIPVGILWGVLVTAACAPAGGMLRVESQDPSSPDAALQAASPTIRVTSGPAGTPSGAIATPTPKTSKPPSVAPEAPEEAVSLEPQQPEPEASAPAVTVKAEDGRAWVDALKADFPAGAVASLADVALNRDADGPVTRGLGFNVPASHSPAGFLWNDGDQDVEAWMPQGIGGFDRDGRRWLVVSWYAKDAKEDTKVPSEALSYRGARLSLVDITDPAHIRYRHVLLVQDAALASRKELFRMGATAKAGYTQGERFVPVPVHAGGVEVFDHWVYLVDTQLGVRVFDLDRLFRAEADPAKSTCGVVNGRLVAFDYRFILPQVAHYKVTGAAPYSCLSLDRSTMTFWLGQYLAPEDAARSAVTGIPLRPDGTLGDRATPMTFPKDKEGYAHRIQGVFRCDGSTWMSITGQTRYEGSTARLARYDDGAATGYRWRWPHGAEDLYYEDETDMLWSLTEFPDSLLARRGRCVFGVRLGSYQSP
jgi:hypothetical protein